VATVGRGATVAIAGGTAAAIAIAVRAVMAATVGRAAIVTIAGRAARVAAIADLGASARAAATRALRPSLRRRF
jgi:hypothetical protein